MSATKKHYKKCVAFMIAAVSAIHKHGLFIKSALRARSGRHLAPSSIRKIARYFAFMPGVLSQHPRKALGCLNKSSSPVMGN